VQGDESKRRQRDAARRDIGEAATFGEIQVLELAPPRRARGASGDVAPAW